MNLKIGNPFYHILSIFLVMAMILEIFPRIPVCANGTENLYGGSVTCRGITARVIEDRQNGENHTLILSGEK